MKHLPAQTNANRPDYDEKVVFRCPRKQKQILRNRATLLGTSITEVILTSLENEEARVYAYGEPFYDRHAEKIIARQEYELCHGFVVNG